MSELPALIRRDWLDVGDGHQLHLAQYGDPDGIPVLYLHGGPGAGCIEDDLVLFADNQYLILMLDQRGAGRSRPIGEIKSNTLISLLKDLEKVREWLSLSAWCIAGGSFGATLGVVYSGLFPERVLSQVLWGLFIPSEDGINWLYSSQGAASLFANEYLDFTAMSPYTADVDALFGSYSEGLNHDDPDTRDAFTQAWLNWERVLALPEDAHLNVQVLGSKSLAEVELHYARHQYFGAYALMRQISAGIQVPTVILQGELDWVCPVQLAENFLREFGSNSINFSVIKSGYHGLANDKMSEEVVYSIRDMANNLKEE